MVELAVFQHRTQILRMVKTAIIGNQNECYISSESKTNVNSISTPHKNLTDGLKHRYRKAKRMLYYPRSSLKHHTTNYTI